MPGLLPVIMPSVILLGSDNLQLATDNAYSVWICLSTIGYSPAQMHSSLHFGSAIPCWDFSRHESPYFPHVGTANLYQASTHLDNTVSLLGFKNLSLRDCFSDLTWTLIPHGRLYPVWAPSSLAFQKCMPCWFSMWVHSLPSLAFDFLC